VESGTQILAHLSPLSSVGQIGSITAGAWDQSNVTANSIGFIQDHWLSTRQPVC